MLYAVPIQMVDTIEILRKENNFFISKFLQHAI